MLSRQEVTHVRFGTKADVEEVVELWRLDYLVESYLDDYHQARPHQRKENRPLLGVWPEIDDLPDSGNEIACHEWLGGVLKSETPFGRRKFPRFVGFWRSLFAVQSGFS